MYEVEILSGQIPYNTLKTVQYQQETLHGAPCVVLLFQWTNGRTLKVYQKDSFVKGKAFFGNPNNIEEKIPENLIFAVLSSSEYSFYSYPGGSFVIDQLDETQIRGEMELYIGNGNQSGVLKIRFRATK